ncbi:precorrin-3B C(17)-methyltransferase [Pseudonocardiaceae bacterium YIM PH 21723]|nr:precorrin-3B C(17)-methyltransferase [Pseudonocardiaceae bacterium YIM PH 21723]
MSRGTLTVVGLGPGNTSQRTPAAAQAIAEADVVIGYSSYVDACADLLGAHQTVIRARMTEEAERAEQAVNAAMAEHRVVLVSSGDAGVYGMATLALQKVTELPEDTRPQVKVLPGITAALAASALVGAPLAHDFATLTLSDILNPWHEIERRLRAVAVADLALALYNPRSATRDWQLSRAREVLLEYRPADTPVALVTDAERPDQRIVLTTLSDMDVTLVDMRTIVLVGSSTTVRSGQWLFTPRTTGQAR